MCTFKAKYTKSPSPMSHWNDQFIAILGTFSFQMNYIYVIVPICFSLLLFDLTVGYMLLVKYKTNRLLKSLRRRMILEYCGPEFSAKPPDITHGREPFTGVYRGPSAPIVNQGSNQMPAFSEFFEDVEFGNMPSPDENPE